LGFCLLAALKRTHNTHIFGASGKTANIAMQVPPNFYFCSLNDMYICVCNIYIYITFLSITVVTILNDIHLYVVHNYCCNGNIVEFGNKSLKKKKYIYILLLLSIPLYSPNIDGRRYINMTNNTTARVRSFQQYIGSPIDPIAFMKAQMENVQKLPYFHSNLTTMEEVCFLEFVKSSS